MKLIFALLAALLIAPMAMAQDSYLIKPGDVLKVEILEDSSLNRSTLVLPDGRISYPLAGTILAAGRSIEQVQADLAAKLAPNFAAPPNVFVSLDSLAPRVASGGVAAVRTVSVYVIGEVGKPGKIEVEQGTSLMQLFAEIGGFSKFAATKRIQLRRTDKSGVEKVYTINYDAIERGAANMVSGNVADGDVIVVPQRRLFE